ncbi:helix-turn-helix transcriptional regulator [uncultured Parasutterella sp.]|uniref:helix-turn-helix domain-containing protein n=1 Tax=uncultured Parasutterella sp. TaxID=1263098 RepID=UPI002592C5FF|nr:helix-turn-helix transcriptional regulator [uncultured Parasutterella sp.]
MTTLSERINAALEYRKMSQSELARRLGVTRQAVSLWCAAGTKDISATNAMLIAKELEVDPYWLVLGKGEMKPPKRLEEHEIKMVNVMQKLDEDSKNLAIKLIEQLKTAS